MQPFRVREDARTWFKELREREKSFKIDFDTFYFCFMAGIATNTKASATNDNTAELVVNFPGPYQNRAKLLVALFLTRELKTLGLTPGERMEAHQSIAKLVSYDSPNHLTAAGVAEFNKYAHGGFDVLFSWFDDKPRSLETFLRGFKRKLDAEMAKQA
jgi:hypothetical protein